MKKAQAKSIFAILILFLISVFIVSSVAPVLISPVDNFVDDDGYLDLRGSCESTSENNYDGTTSWNVTNATLYSSVSGSWQINKTLQVANPLANNTYFFNFTNDVNQSAQGEFKWNIQCNEANASNNGININKAFAGNRTIKVQYLQPTVTTTSPLDNSYSLNGHEISVVCTGQASTAWNLTSISLLTNIREVSLGSGSGENWTVNQTHTPLTPEEGVVIANFTINKFGNASIPDGSNLLFGCLASQQKNNSDSGNEPLILSNDASANRTLNVEYPAEVTLNSPSDLNWSSNLRVSLEWTVVSAFTDSKFITRVWTNESGVWALATGSILANNNTRVTQDYTFQELSQVVWGVQAIQQDDGAVFNFSVNRTIRLDSTNPVISASTQNLTTNDDTPTILATVTDLNLDTLRVFTNFSGAWLANYTNNSLISGTETNYFNNTAAVDGVYVYNYRVNDSAGNEVQTVNFSLIIDTIPPGVSSLTNVSVVGACDQSNITFTTSELANATLTFDTDSDTSDGTVVTDSTKKTSHGLVLDFNFNGEITHFFNITVTDVAGNTNVTVVDGTGTSGVFQTPARVCAGWTQWAVYDSTINLSTIQNQSGADLVYTWNATNQDWVFYTAGLTTNEGVDIGFSTDYHVAHLFENTNSTWFRNTTNNGVYHYNVSISNNWVSVPNLYNFGNFTESFMNGTVQFPTSLTNGTHAPLINNGTSLVFNITNFAGYNNSLQDYSSHIFNFTQVNITFLEPCPNRDFAVTCMEAVWIGSGFNVTWNTTNILGNWT